MHICAVHGSGRKGNTDITIDIIRKEMQKEDGGVTFSDIYLPRDLPHFCTGCFACLGKGEYAGEICPHSAFTHPIREKLLAADGILFGSPSYALAETGQVKAFLDHFACTYLVHRPNPEMFDKVALVVATAAGAGTGRTISTIRRNLLFWGVKRSFSCRVNLWEADWARMEQGRRSKAEQRLKKSAVRFYKLTKKRHSLRRRPFGVLLKAFAKLTVSGKNANPPDTAYWKKMGWIR